MAVRRYMYVHYAMNTVWFFCKPCHRKGHQHKKCMESQCEKHPLTVESDHMWCTDCGKLLKLPGGE